jgi:hypothetical protein
MPRSHQPPAKSLANLRPVRPGEIRNPKGINGQRPYSMAMRAMSEEPVPEEVREKLNSDARYYLFGALRRQKPEQKRFELYLPGCTWAEANALRRHLRAVVQGSLGDAIEMRECTEGKIALRIETSDSNSRLKELILALTAQSEAIDEAPALPESIDPLLPKQ